MNTYAFLGDSKKKIVLRWLELIDRGAQRVEPNSVYDVGFSFFHNEKIPDDILSRARLGWVNLHLGPLPRLKGVHSVYHAIRLAPIENIWDFGVTLHYMTNEIDAGPIIGKSYIPIKDTTTAEELYSASLVAATTLLSKKLPHIFASRLNAIAGFKGPEHFFKRADMDHYIDIINMPAEHAMAKIRALTFPGKPRPYFSAYGNHRIHLTLEEKSAH